MIITIQKYKYNGQLLEENIIEKATNIELHTTYQFNWLDVLYNKDNYYYKEPNSNEDYYFKITINEDKPIDERELRELENEEHKLRSELF